MALQLRESRQPSWVRIIPAVIALILQIGLSPQIDVFGGRFNFLLAYALCASLSRDSRSSTIIGFACGLAFDLTSAAPVGLMPLVLTVTCFVTASLARGGLGALNQDSIRLVLVADVAANLLYGFLSFLLGIGGGFVHAVLVLGGISCILDGLCAMLFLFFGSSAHPSRSRSTRSRPQRLKTPR